MERINTTYAVRPFMETDEDYQTIAGIHNSVYTDDRVTVEQLKHWDSARSKDEKYPFHRVMISDGSGQIVGHGEYMQHQSMYHPQKYFWEGFVQAGQDVATVLGAFHEHMLDQLADKDLIALLTATRDDKTDYIAFFEAQGYSLNMRYPQSHITLAYFDPARFADKIRRVEESGIRIITAPQLRAERPDDWQSIMHELEWEIGQDVPQPDPPQKKTLEEWIKSRLDNPSLMLDGHFIAVDGDRCVGVSNLWKDLANPERLWTGLTGVVRSHRRRGIARALKVYALSYAKSLGIKTVQTDNEENNPMYELNMQLGFTPLPAWVDYEKSLEESTS